MLLLNAYVQTFHVGLQKFYNIYFIAGAFICTGILFWPEQWKNCIKPTELFYFTYLYVYILPTLPEGCLLVKKGREEKEFPIALFFNFSMSLFPA